jgi:hypothetical protein
VQLWLLPKCTEGMSLMAQRKLLRQEEYTIVSLSSSDEGEEEEEDKASEAR